MSLLVEKYRPTKITDCVLPKNIKQMFVDIAKTGDAEKFMVLSEFAFMTTNPNAHAKVFNLA